MTPGNRIVINTLVQYVRSLVYMLLTLFSTRFVLDALGHSAYGVYALVGSVVYMAGFLTQSLATSTQRFLSYSHGLSDKEELNRIFSNAFFLHIVVALTIVLVMTVIEPICMDKLNIPTELASTSVFVYYTVVLMVMLTFVTSPVRALFIARENIVYVSVIEMLDAVLKLAGAIALPYIPIDSLKLYAMMMALISVFNFSAYYIYASIRYEECRRLRLSVISLPTIRRLLNFAVWNVYAVGATVMRTQGLAVVFNRFLGTIANAAYGIALQVSNAAGFIALSILNAVNPQLMKAEGAGDRKRMLHLSMTESKYAFLTMGLILIPVIVEMPEILIFWLGNVPEFASLFCRFVLIAYIMDQLTIGLTSANQAIGKIRNYSLLISTIRLITFPIAWGCLQLSLSPLWVMCSYLFVEMVIGIIRIPYMKHSAGLPVYIYINKVCVHSILPIVGTFFAAYIIATNIQMPYRFMLTEFCSVCMGVVLVYFFSLEKEERVWIKTHIDKIRKRK